MGRGGRRSRGVTVEPEAPRDVEPELTVELLPEVEAPRYVLIDGKHSEWTPNGNLHYRIGDIIPLTEERATSLCWAHRVRKITKNSAPM